jgi:hypothetical protein
LWPGTSLVEFAAGGRQSGGSAADMAPWDASSYQQHTRLERRWFPSVFTNSHRPPNNSTRPLSCWLRVHLCQSIIREPLPTLFGQSQQSPAHLQPASPPPLSPPSRASFCRRYYLQNTLLSSNIWNQPADYSALPVTSHRDAPVAKPRASLLIRCRSAAGATDCQHGNGRIIWPTCRAASGVCGEPNPSAVGLSPAAARHHLTFRWCAQLAPSAAAT